MSLRRTTCVWVNPFVTSCERLMLVGLGAVFLTIIGCASSSPRVSLAYFPPAPAPARVVHLISFNSLHDLVVRKPSFVEAVRGGIVSPFVAVPAGIAYRAGLLYICDTSKRVVHRWDLMTGEALRPLDGGEPTFELPVAVVVEENGTTYVADAAAGAVLGFDEGGQLNHRYSVADRQRYRPVAVAQQAGQLFVADIASHSVDVFSVKTGERVKSFGGLGSATGKFYYPMGVAISNARQLIVSDMMNSRVQVFDELLESRLTIGQPGNRYGDMGKPRHIAIGPDGVIFIADAEFLRVHMFDSQGQLLMILGSDAGHPGGMAMPVGVAVATALPESIVNLVPTDFNAHYYLFVTNTIGKQRISLYAVGQ